MAELDKLALGAGLKALAAMAVLLMIAIAGLTFVSQGRNRAMVDKYTQETLAFIAINPSQLREIFTTVFDQAEACQRLAITEPAGLRSCEATASAQITLTNTGQLKDYSSIVFWRLKKNQVQQLQLSGMFNGDPVATWEGEFFGGRSNGAKLERVRQLLQGKLSRLTWDDYSYVLPGKEVVVPVEIDGQVIGAIVRGVIE